MRALRRTAWVYPLTVVVLTVALTASGCIMGTEKIDVQYIPGYDAEQMFFDHQPSIALNTIWDERPIKDRVGEGYTMYGDKTETWVTEKAPTAILEEALLRQLQSIGFRVVRTSGWDLSAGSIPTYLNSDLIAGGRLRAFWVESRPGLLTVSVNSNVTFDLIIADIKTGKIIWAGQFTGTDKPETIVRLNRDMEDSLSRSLTQAVNNAFSDESVRRAFANALQIRF